MRGFRFSTFRRPAGSPEQHRTSHGRQIVNYWRSVEQRTCPTPDQRRTPARLMRRTYGSGVLLVVALGSNLQPISLSGILGHAYDFGEDPHFCPP